MSKYQDDYYDFAKHSNPDIFKDGVEMFRLAKYKEAIKLFKHLITKHYRPATDNFYIGESYYYLNEYSLAVKHYKDSVSIYDKSSFMPTLLLHSAISLEKIGDSREAQIFYKVLQTQYGDTPEGKKASELISN
jgi:TolA-binding protein